MRVSRASGPAREVATHTKLKNLISPLLVTLCSLHEYNVSNEVYSRQEFRESSNVDQSHAANVRAGPSNWSDATARQQQGTNAAMWLIKSPPNLMQRLSRFPAVPTSRFSIAEPNRIPDLMTTPPFQSRFTSDGVASTYRIHPEYRTCPISRLSSKRRVDSP